MATFFALRTGAATYELFHPQVLLIDDVQYQPQFFEVADDDELAAIGVWRVDVTPPDGQRWTGAFADSGGLPVAVYEDIPPPDRVTSRQFKLQLLAYPAIGGGETLLDDVEAWIATQDRAVQVAFANSGTFVRDEPMMQAGFAALGFSAPQIDAFFMEASGL